MQDRTRRALLAARAWTADVFALALALVLATPVAFVILFLIGWAVLG